MVTTPLRRSRRRRLLGGVCGGVAERYGWNVTLVRVVWLVLAALPVLPGAVVYVALWALVPIEEPIRQPGR